MKKITIAALLIISQSAFAQVTSEELKKEITPLIKKIEVLETKASKQGKEIEGLNFKLSTANKQIDSLENKTATNEVAISQTKTDLTNEITKSGVASDGKITIVSKDLSKNSLYGIIGVLLAVLLSGVLFIFWKKRQDTDKSELINKMDNYKK